MHRFAAEIASSPLGQCCEAHSARDSGCDDPPKWTTPETETDRMPVDEVRRSPSLGESISSLVSDRQGCVARSAYGLTRSLQKEPPDDPKTSFVRVRLSRYKFRSRPGFRNILRPEVEHMHAERESAKPGSLKRALCLKESSALAPGHREGSLLCIQRKLADAMAWPHSDRS